MSTSKYTPNLSPGTRVLFTGQERHPKNGQHCTIIRALPNPSNRADNQWYDVRFGDQSMARFKQRYLARLDKNGEKTAA